MVLMRDRPRIFKVVMGKAKRLASLRHRDYSITENLSPRSRLCRHLEVVLLEILDVGDFLDD